MTGCKLRSLWCPRLGTCLLLVGLLAVAGLPVLPGQAALAQREPPYAEQNFAEAFKLFADQLYEQAVQAFASFRTTYPDHVNAAEALYYEAAASLALGREEEAVRLLTLFQERYPVHPLAFQARLALGKHFYEAEEHERALETLTDVLSEDPPPELAAKALYWMGEAALELGRTEEALRYFQRAADDYRSTETASVALYAIASVQLQHGAYDEAARAFEVLGARYPDSPYARDIGLALAEVYYELGDYARTVAEIERRQPGLEGAAEERAAFLLAESYNQLRDSQNAILHYRRITEGDPNSPYYRPALYGLAWNYYFEEAYEWAADHFARVREGPEDALAEKATYYEAVNRKLNQRPREAIDLLETFVRRWPDSELADQALYELGVSYYEQRMWQQANETLEALIRSHPDSERLGDALYLQGNTFIALGEYDPALETFDQAIALDAAPASLQDEIVFQKAWLLYRNGEYRRAAPAFIELYERSDGGARAGEALFWAAESYYQMEEYDRSVRLFNDYLRSYSGGRHVDAAHYALGWAYFRQSRYEEAARAFERFLRDYREQQESVPYRTDALLRLADSYYALKRYPEAIRAYAQVGEEGGDYALYQTGQAYANAGDAYEAITTFRRLLSEHPESEWAVGAQYQLGYLYFLNQDYDQAIAAYQELIETVPRDPLAAKAQYGIGDALFNAGRLEASVDAYREVLERYSSSPIAADAASSLHYALIALGDERRAEEIIDEFAARHPDSPVLDELRFRQAEVRYQSGRIEEALADFQRFVDTSRNPSLTAEANYYLGLIYAEQQDYGQAEASLRRLVDGTAPSPRGLEAARRLGELYLEQDRDREALDVYRKMESMASEDARATAEARYGQSMALLNLGQTQEAEQLLQDALEAAPEAPTSIPALLGLARVHEAQGRPGDAVRLYRQVVDRSQDEVGAEALYRLGSLLHERGNARAAVEELSRMATLFPNYPQWVAQGYLAQARAFHSLGQRGDAVRLYDRVLSEFADTPYAETAAREKAAM